MKNKYFLLIGIFIASLLSLVFSGGESFAKSMLKSRSSTKLSRKKITVLQLSADLSGIGKEIKLKDIKPPVSGRIGFPPGTDLQELEQVTDESIKYLYNLAKRYKKDRDRADIWLRLARQYFEKSKLVKLKLHEKYHKRKKYKKNINFNSAYVYNKKSLKLYLWFLKTFPSDKRSEKVYVFAIKNYLLFDQVGAAALLYKPFLRKYSKSAYKEEVSFLIADYYFSKFSWKKARNFYKEGLKSSIKKLKYLIYYKLAWVEHKMGRYKTAFYYLDLVLRNTKSNKLLSFRVIAIKDLPYFYSRYGKAVSAQKFFLKYISEAELKKPLALLASYYFSDGKKQEANAIWRKLILMDPLAELNFDYAYKIIQSHKYRKSVYKNLILVKKWLSDYGINSRWFRRNPRLRKKYVAKQEQYVRYLISDFYKTKNKKKKIQNLLVLYPLYLKNFSSDKKNRENLLEIKFLYADLLFEQKKYGSAQRQYSEIASLGASKFYKKALYNQVLCNEKRLLPYFAVQKKTKGFTKKLAIVGVERQFELSALGYLKKYSDLNLEYRLGLFYYNRIQLSLAEVVLSKYLKNSLLSRGSTKLQKQVLSWLVDIYSKNKEYHKIKQLFLSHSKLASSQKFQLQQDKVYFKVAEDLEKEKKYKKAIAEYAKVVLRRESLATPALFNQANLYFKLGQVSRAISIFKKISILKSKDLYKKANLSLISIYRERGLYVKVAQVLEGLARHRFRESSSWLYSAGILRKALRHYSSSTNNFNQFLLLTKSQKKKDEVKLILIDLYIARNHLSKAVKSLKDYYKLSTNDEKKYYAANKLIAVYKKLNQLSKAKWWEKKLLSEYHTHRLRFKRHDSILAVVAQIKYNQARLSFSKLLRFKFQKKLSLKYITKKKISLLEGVKKTLKAVVSLGNPEYLLKSLVLEADAESHTALFFRDLPIPKSLKGKNRDVYVQGVRSFTNPMLLEGKKLYQLTLDKAYDFEFYNQSVISAYNNIAKFNLNRDYISYTDRLRVAPVSSGKFLYRRKYEQSFSSYAKMKSFALSKIKGSKTEVDFWFILVGSYIGLGFPEMAQLILEDNNLLKKHSGAYYNDKAVLSWQASDISQSLSFLKQITKDDLVKQPYVGINLASLYARYTEFNKASSILNYLNRKKYFFPTTSLNNYAVTEELLGNSSRAQKLYKKALNKDEDNPLVLFNYAYFLVQHTKNFSKALSLLERAKVWNRNKKLLKLIKVLENKIKGLI